MNYCQTSGWTDATQTEAGVEAFWSTLSEDFRFYLATAVLILYSTATLLHVE